MLGQWMERAWDLVRKTFRQWREHRSAQLAASLAFFGALSLAGLALIAVYVAGLWFGHGRARAQTTGSTRHVAGAHNAHFVEIVLREAASRHNGWIALVVGVVIFVLAVAGSALQLQRAVDAIWDAEEHGERSPAKAVKRHVPQFLAIYVLTFVLIVLLFAGATLHALTYHTHHIPALQGTLYQVLDVAVSIVVLTFVFLFIFAYLPPVDVPWRNVWIASFVSAVLYERGQFGLALYFGQMDATSPYGDAGALLALLLWLYYSAQVVLIGADFTKVLKEDAESRDKRNTRAA